MCNYELINVKICALGIRYLIDLMSNYEASVTANVKNT